MKRIHYAGSELLTGDRIAEAVIDYATALARRVRADRIAVPVVIEGGTLEAGTSDRRMRRVELVLGPASQLVVESIDDTREDPVDERLVEELQVRTARLHDPRPVATSADGRSVVDGYDLPDDLFD